MILIVRNNNTAPDEPAGNHISSDRGYLLASVDQRQESRHLKCLQYGFESHREHMGTIFIQLVEEDYNILVDGMCSAINATELMASKELDNNLKLKLKEESIELERVLSEIGNQASSQ
jgi:hypothetical protein